MSKDMESLEGELENASEMKLKRDLRAARASTRDYANQLEDLKKRLALYERVEKSQLAPPKWLTPKRKRHKHVAIPSMLLTDVHWGEVVVPEQVGGVNKYNVEIAQKRIRRAFDRCMRVTQEMWSGVEYEGFNLLLGGDILSGIIHEELRESNEETVFESVLGVVECIAAGSKMVAEAFGKLHIAAVVGNHGRLTRKPRAKNKVKESLDWMVYQLLARELKDIKGVTVQVPNAADCRFSVHNTRYCLTHGDQFRGGHGIAAALSPILLGIYRKSKRDASAGNPWDVLVMGHWHHPYWLPNAIAGGAIKGYDEFAFNKNFDFQEPTTDLWLNTPERGITIHSPLFVQDRAEEKW